VGVDGAPIYGRTCLFLGCSKAKPKAIRLKTAGSVKKFQDRVFGELSQNVDTEVGDFVIRRSDGFYAYHLAVVVDDALQGVTEIVRGYDLFVSTPRHLLLQERLRFFHPSYAHVPLVLNEGGEKLSKQTLAPALNADKIVDLLFACLNFLGQRANAAWRHETPEQILRMAAMEWDWNLVPKVPGKVTRWE
jgi:glutamyl-Q tRNA(Asp) synthetase